MSEFTFNFENKRKKTKQRVKNDTWMLSYADIVTVLLCFFIIFYSIEKQIEKKIENEIKGYSDQSGILREHKEAGIDTKYNYAIEVLSDLKDVNVIRSSSFVDIYFGDVVFFKKGKFQLTNEGKKLIDNITERLQKIGSKYRLEIQGHADKTPVAKKKQRWWDSNMELSVLRSLNVYKYMIRNNLPKSHLSVAGYGDHKSLAPGEKSIIPENRRISLRLQLVEK